jgi:hypothetical protein
MRRRKTLLSPEDQWDQTAAYFMQLIRSNSIWREAEGIVEDLCIFHGTHPLVRDGDVLLLTSRNGMVQRLGMTGITSKGVRLKNYFLPLRRGFEELQFPDDFTGMQWNDPAIGRYVADLRASRRGRVSAYSPAPHNCKTSSAVDTSGITCFGLYKSARLPESTRMLDHRNYLRFYSDGSVVHTLDFNHQGWRISWDQNSTSPVQYPERPPTGTVHAKNNRVAFDLHWMGAHFARYEGHFENGRLWLSCDSPHSDVAHGKMPYRFHPFNADAYDTESSLNQDSSAHG